MENRPEQTPSNVSSEQRKSSELLKLICKLRWMGMKDEAMRVQMQLALSGAAPSDSVIATTRETD